ncbi:MAG: dihydroneopterin aldolase [Chloroflexota bacterium]
MDKVIIKDLLVRGIIGLNDWEREKEQDILINIELFANLHSAGESDEIRNSVNYRTISKKVMVHAESIGRLTVEALAADIAKICLEDPNAQKVKVRVEKPGAVRFAKSVGVEIERSKS